MVFSPFPSNHSGSSSTKETNEERIGDLQGSVFLFQPDINENKMIAKEVELEPEVDLELRLFTCPSEIDGNNPGSASSSKKLPLNVLGDEASCCWEIVSPRLSLSLSTSQNRSDRLTRAYGPSNSIAASHSSVASNSTGQVGASSHDTVVLYNSGRKRCEIGNCTGRADRLSGLCIAHANVEFVLID